MDNLRVTAIIGGERLADFSFYFLSYKDIHQQQRQQQRLRWWSCGRFYLVCFFICHLWAINSFLKTETALGYFADRFICITVIPNSVVSASWWLKKQISHFDADNQSVHSLRVFQRLCKKNKKKLSILKTKTVFTFNDMNMKLQIFFFLSGPQVGLLLNFLCLPHLSVRTICRFLGRSEDAQKQNDLKICIIEWTLVCPAVPN